MNKPHCRVQVRDSTMRGGPYSLRYCDGKVTRDGMCTRHANLADKQKAERALATEPHQHGGKGA